MAQEIILLENNIDQLRKIFEFYPDLVRNSHEETLTPVLEVEAKFGYYIGQNFNSNVPYIHYERLIERLRKSSIFSESLEESTVTIFGNIRRIVTTIEDSNEKVLWQTKDTLTNIELIDYDIRISVNKETYISEPANNLLSGIPVIRERTRRSFLMNNKIIRVDVSSIMTIKDQDIIESYEVEVEYLGDGNNLHIFDNYIKEVFRLLRGTNRIFTNKNKRQLIQDCNKVLKQVPTPFKINKDIFVEARNITFRDLVYGGIVGNNNIEDKEILASKRNNHKGNGTAYDITFKANGLRKLFIIHKTGIWLVHSPYEFNFLTTIRKEVIDAYDTTILDGELVIPKTPNNILYWYLSFDCLVFKNNDKQKDNKLQRRKFIETVSKSIRSSLITVDFKETEEIKTVEDFFALVNKFLDNRNKLPYLEDGLMFSPIDVQYNPLSQNKYTSSERTLTKVPDVCKWKNPKDITIDFSIRWVENNKLELYSFDDSKNKRSATKGKMVIFTGDDFYPLTPDMIDHENPLTLNKPTGLVVEYEWSDNKLRPRILRYDKHGPNRLSVAKNNWRDIMNPITEDDIRGRSLTLVYKYFNRIKKGLYNMLGSANILDIGSGKGGDVSKWKTLGNTQQNKGFVIAVEPNQNNRQELIRRIEINKITNKVFVLPVGGEDTVTITSAIQRNIPEGKVDAISLMLSLSFFWSSKEHLDSLVNTIITNLKPGGKIIFLTIDGDTLEQLFGTSQSTEINLLTAKIRLYPKEESGRRAVDFILPDTIVGEQREYVVHIQDLVNRLEKEKIFLKEFSKAEEEKLLIKDAKLFSSLYSYGMFVSERDETKQHIILPEISTQFINFLLDTARKVSLNNIDPVDISMLFNTLNINDISKIHGALREFIYYRIGEIGRYHSIITPWRIETFKSDNPSLKVLLGKYREALPVLMIVDNNKKYLHDFNEELLFGILCVVEFSTRIQFYLNDLVNMNYPPIPITFKDIAPEFLSYTRRRYSATTKHGTIYFASERFIQGIITGSNWLQLNPYDLITDIRSHGKLFTF